MLLSAFVIDKYGRLYITDVFQFVILLSLCCIFRLDALALSVIATATWLAGWLGGCHTRVLYQNC